MQYSIRVHSAASHRHQITRPDRTWTARLQAHVRWASRGAEPGGSDNRQVVKGDFSSMQATLPAGTRIPHGAKVNPKGQVFQYHFPHFYDLADSPFSGELRAFRSDNTWPAVVLNGITPPHVIQVSFPTPGTLPQGRQSLSGGGDL